MTEKAKANVWLTDWIEIAPQAMNQLIFNHSFAKAFWGSNPGICDNCRGEHDQSLPVMDHLFDCYHMHLKIMVLEKEPIKYLEKFV